MTDIVDGYVYGLRDIKLTNLAGSSQVDLPAAQTITWKETIVSDSLRGDDKIVSTVAFVEGGEFSLEAGGISLEAYAMLTGETVVSAGTTPNRTITVTRNGATSFPWLKIYGRALGDNGDGIHVKLRKAKLTSLEGNLTNQEFYITKAGGMFIADASDELYDIVKLETDAALPTS
ncbi:MAG: hypothetical protein FOGNACKC_02237 [Anaerolineae bacterium]|nr:hypothetical protein [Anaerolineae bacterium]